MFSLLDLRTLEYLSTFQLWNYQIRPKLNFENNLSYHFLLASNAVTENVFERIDRALPELGLLENRNKWEDALKEYGTMWNDAMKE